MYFLIPLLIGIVATLLLLPPFIKRILQQNFVGTDMNKFNKPKIAELGGVSVFLGFSFALFSAIFLATYLNIFQINLGLLLAGFSTIAIIAFIGFIDDIIGWKKGIRQWQHALFPIVAALPLMAISAGNTSMIFPLIGHIELGIIYSLVIIPIGITGASNAFNMLAGFNGLEAGQGIILTSILTIIAFFSGQTTAIILGLAMIGALIGFLKFNWFPAKIFGGDSLTLMVGANLAVMSIIGNMESFGAMLFVLFFVEFLIKAKHKMQSECFGIPNKNGLLHANPKGGSVTQFILKLKPMKEYQVTLTILTIQLFIGVIVLAIFFLK
jgi:UDP-N-acetylglucosamine--dolichyl-phosphate N-acetylglucosaminephosphotransferase